MKQLLIAEQAQLGNPLTSSLGVIIRNQCVIDLTIQCLILIHQFPYDCPAAEQMLRGHDKNNK